MSRKSPSPANSVLNGVVLHLQKGRLSKKLSSPGGEGWLSSKESAYNERDTGLVPGPEDPLEKEMAAHSSILTWEMLKIMRVINKYLEEEL